MELPVSPDVYPLGLLQEYKSSDAVSRHIKDLRADAMALPLSPDVSPLGLLQEFKSMLLS